MNMGVVIELPKDREERKLKKVKISLMRNPLFVHLSGVMMVGKTEVRDDVPTAYTNGRDEVYGRSLLKWLNEKELAFVVLHENMHKAYRHMHIWRKLFDENPRLANQACDYVINLMLVNSDPDQKHIAMPTKDGKNYGLLDARFANMNTKQVFDILKQEKSKDGEEGEEGEEGNEGFDEHDWEGAKEMSDEEKKELEKEVDRALRQGQIAAGRMAGNGAGGIGRAIGELLIPEIDWKEVLREFVTSICNNKDTSSWRKPNRRFIGDDVYMPSLTGESVGRIVVGIDTSGSIGGKILDKFLSEVKAIADDVKPEAIELLYWDSEVAGHETYDASNRDTLVTSTKPKGGGGTDPSCVPAYIKDKDLKPECVVMLTDGHVGNWGEWNVPVLWVVVGSNNVSPVGKTVNVKEM
jgi:predicted metal-dependent peptidase